MPFCGKCGTQLVDASQFCHMCGAKSSSKNEICKNCGQQLVFGSRFCYKCGYPTNNSESKQNQANGENVSDMIRCPNCGSNVGRLDAACHFCGMQIVQRNVSKSVKSFAEELARIELEEKDLTEQFFNKPDSFWDNSKSYEYAKFKENEKRYGSKAFERKISYINSFPIPNTVEEIIEFMLLAVANIDAKYGLNCPDNVKYGKPGMLYYTEIKVATTWINKLEQAYNKASIVFPNDPVFSRIQTIYVNKMKELNRIS
jgi:uncharacterized OB-fold protein